MSIRSAAPLIVVAVGAITLLVFGSFLKRNSSSLLAALSLVVIGGAFGFALWNLGHSVRAFDETIASDGFSVYFQLLLLAAAGLTVLTSHHFLDQEGEPATEFYGLMLFSTAGMMLMALATDLILVFLALETFSLALYVLAAFRRTRLDSQEGALKYFLTGSFSSAFFLYGTALIFGATGTTRFIGIAIQVKEVSVLSEPLLAGGLALVIVGLAFKIAAVPFHMWTPDAYQGSPSPVSGFMAAGSKAAGFAVLLRLVVAVFPAFIWDLRPVLIGLAVTSMVVGSVVAVAQTNIKRMLAYSAIAHSGFLLIGVIAANARGVSGSMFYVGAYGFTILGAFAVIYTVAGRGDQRVQIDDLRGLWSRQPFLAGTFAVLLVSLAGIPPTAGFWAKWEVFYAAISAHQTPVVVVAVTMSMVAAFFYLRIIVFMFLEPPQDWMGPAPSTAPSSGLVITLVCALVIFLGLFPTPLLDLVRHAHFAFR